MNLGKALRRSRGRVDVMATEVTAKLEGLVDGKVGKVLAAESNDLALGNVASQLVLSGVAELAQLDAPDLRTDGGRQVSDLSLTLGEKVGETGVCVLSVFYVLEWLQREVFLLGVPRGEVVRILHYTDQSLDAEMGFSEERTLAPSWPSPPLDSVSLS